MTGRTTFVYALLTGALMLSEGMLARAQTAEAALVPGIWDDAFYAPEEGMCYSPPEGDGILSVGGSYYDDIRVPCWASRDLNCKGDIVINIGDLWSGKTGSTTELHPDAYYEDGECGYGTYAGYIPSSDDGFYAYVGDALAMVTGNSNSYGVGAHLQVYEFTSADCSTGYTNRSWLDPDYYDAAYGGYWQCCWVDPVYSDEYRSMAGWGIGDCSGYPDLDPGGTTHPTPSNPYCHMPDVWITDPGTSGYRSYLYRIYTKVCQNAACTSGCSSLSYQSGCFQIYWQ